MKAGFVAAWLVAFLLLCGVASASNMGLALRMQLTSTPERLHFISLPYLYTPATAEALCQDLGGSGDVSGILRWDETSSTFVEYACGSGSGDFALEEGVAYGVRVAAYQDVDTLIVGIHDDAFEFDFAPGTGTNLHWISPPYHLALPDAGGLEDVTDAEDLCRQAGVELFSVVRWNEATGCHQAYLCGSEFAVPFELEQGVGYGLINADGETLTWQPTHY
jgi:hypothetical protein